MIIHAVVSITIGFISFASAWGGALSDTYQEHSDLPDTLLTILEAPVVLLFWIGKKYSPQTISSLDLASVVLIALMWSGIFGWLCAITYQKLNKQKKLK